MVEHQCYRCYRWGSRGFHQNKLMANNVNSWRCNAAKACETRQYRRFVGLDRW